MLVAPTLETWQTMLVYRSPEVQIKFGPRMVADLQIKQLT